MAQARPSQRRPNADGGHRPGWFLSGAVKGFVTAVGLVAVFGAYHAVTMSFRSPPAKPRRHAATQNAVPMPSRDHSGRMAEQFLSKYEWTAAAKNQGRTVDGSTYYYFQEWKQESDTVVRFRPFAMVSKRKDSKPTDRPYTVVSDAAYITFASKFSLLGGNPGAIVRAELEGAVGIEGPNNLRIEGRNFYFQKGDPNVIYSDDLLSFWADRHFGKAKGMQLELLRDPKAKPDEAISIGGISSVKLLQDVDMTLVTDSLDQQPQRNGTPQTPLKPGSPRTPSRPQAVRCQSVGSFTFVLATREATFERNVRIRRETLPKKFDSIAADDSIKIVFDAKTPPSGSASGATPAVAQAAAAPSPAKVAGPAAIVSGQSANGANPPSGTFDPNLSFKEIHAHGKMVSLLSEANGLKALMHELDYDRLAHHARLAAAPNRVQILHNGDRLSAPVIELDHDETGQQIVQVWCRGEGDMKHVDEKTHEIDLAADWKKEMHKYPDPKSSFDLVDLEEAMIEQPKESSGIAADHIRLFIERQGTDQRRARPNLPPSAKPAQTGMQLDHMIAWQETEKVAMVSRQFEAEAKHLEIWFEDGSLGAPRPDDESPRQRTNLVPTSKWLTETEPSNAQLARPQAAGLRANGVQMAPLQMAEVQPVGLRATESDSPASIAMPAVGPAKKAAAAPAKSTSILPGMMMPGAGDSTEPYVMKATTIYVRVLRGAAGGPAQVAQVISKGNVQLTQAQKNKAEPLVVEGNELEVQNRGPLDQQIVVLGQPAHVRNRGAHIEGSHIVFDRLHNTSDVEGAGKLQLPVKQSVEAGQPERSTPFDVVWQNKMHFDGKTATFLGSVRSKMDDGQEKTEVRCQQMAVNLTKPFSFTQEHKEGEQPEVQSIDCYGGVDFDSDSTVDGKLTEVRRGVFAQLHFDKPSGSSQASGPGRLRVWRHNENGQSGMSQFTNVQSNAPPKSRKANTWEYMKVEFAGKMDGDFTQMLSPSSASAPARPRPKRRQPSPGSSILGSTGAWTMVFHDHVEVIYGPVDQPPDSVSRDYLIEQAGWLGCKVLTIQQHPQSETKDQFVTMLAAGDSQIEGKDFFGEAESISYDGSKTLYVLRGDGNRDARLTRQLKVGGDLSKTNSNQILFNPVEHWMRQDQTKNLDWSQ